MCLLSPASMVQHLPRTLTVTTSQLHAHLIGLKQLHFPCCPIFVYNVLPLRCLCLASPAMDEDTTVPLPCVVQVDIVLANPLRLATLANEKKINLSQVSLNLPLSLSCIQQLSCSRVLEPVRTICHSLACHPHALQGPCPTAPCSLPLLSSPLDLAWCCAQVQFLVLDEADRLFDMGFVQQV